MIFKKKKKSEIKYNIYDSRMSQDVTYYTCMKILSESVAKLPIHLVDNEGNKIADNKALKCLSYKPNPFMTPATLKQVLEYHRNYFGNAYAYIEYDKNHDIKGLYPLNPENVRIYIDNENIFKESKYIYSYFVPGTDKEMYIPSTQVIHLKGGLSTDGITGKSVHEQLKDTFVMNSNQDKCLNELYESGLSPNAVISYTGDLDRKKKSRLIEELTSFKTNSTTRLIPIPFGMDLKPIEMKLTDSQFYELKKYSNLQIASTFGIKPNHLNDYEKSSYSNSEMQNLTFYVDTLLYILTQYEEEFNSKLLTEDERNKGYRFKFNVSSILRGDIKTQSESIAKLVQSAVYTVNEARKYLGMPSIKGGNTIMVNGAYVRLEEIGKAYDNKNNDVKGGVNDDRREEENSGRTEERTE